MGERRESWSGRAKWRQRVVKEDEAEKFLGKAVPSKICDFASDFEGQFAFALHRQSLVDVIRRQGKDFMERDRASPDLWSRRIRRGRMEEGD